MFMKRIVMALALGALAATGCTTTTGEIVVELHNCENAEGAFEDFFVDWGGSVQDCPANSTARITGDYFGPGDVEGLIVDIFGPETATDGIFSDAQFFGSSGTADVLVNAGDLVDLPVAFQYGFFTVGWTIDGLPVDAGLCGDPVEPVGDIQINTDLLLDDGSNLLLDETYDCLDGADGVTSPELQFGDFDVSFEAFDPNGTSLGTSQTLAEDIVVHLENVDLGDFDIQFN